VSAIDLSVVVVIGPVRDRAQRVVDALCDQTAAECMELVLVDTCEDELPRMRTAERIRAVHVRPAPASTWGEARSAGLLAATAPVVAFLEDHCFPEPAWARALIDAHRGDWAAVGYSFTNANPDGYVSRASFVVDYGTWAAPREAGEAAFLQNNNISYKRSPVMELGLPLDELLETDWNVQEALKQQGYRLYLESLAVASHHNFTSVREMLSENFSHCRAVAASRRRREEWGWWRTAAQAVATPFVAPPIRLARLVRGAGGRRALRADLIRALPLVALAYPYAAIGESLGYLTGLGDTDRALQRSLLETRRERR
jgi:hypothetical protein